MILNILIAVLLIGFVAIAIAVYQINAMVQDMFYEIDEINEDIDGIDEVIFTKILTKKK
jgi:hypothetical protein